MAKKLNITPVSSDNVCVPSDILGHCEEIYSKFEKDVKKYAPGNLAFFKFNSTIVENLQTLKENTGNSLYIVAVYQSYFKNCKGLDKIEKITKKILNKLDSLLESIGSGKNASISTKGLKGLFSKKRSRNEDFEKLYKYFLEIKTNMQTTIDHNGINTKFLPTNFKFKILRPTSGAHPDDLSENISKMTKQKELLDCLNSRDLTFFLESVDVSALQDNVIPSYGEVVSKFLEDAQIEYTNFYTIQHQFKELYDVKGTAKGNYPKQIQDMKKIYKSQHDELKEREKDLIMSYQCLEELSKKFAGKWSKKIEGSLNDIFKIKNDIDALRKDVKDANKSFRSSIFSNEDSANTNSYESMLNSISISMRLALTNISQSQANISSPACEYDTIIKKLPSIMQHFEASKLRINDCIEKAALKDFNSSENGLEGAIKKYNEIYTNSEKKIEEIINKINGLSTKQVKYIIDLIGKEEAEKSFNKLKSLTGYIGTALGVSISIAGAIIGCYQKAKTVHLSMM